MPIGASGRVLPNRIWLPAMVTWRGTEDGFVTPAVHDIYLRYAQGRAGMIVLEATGVRDVASGPLLRLSHDRYVPGLAALVAEMRAVTDSLIVPQIIDFLNGYRQTIEDLGKDEIRRIPGWFADAARRAKEAGFDGVELHFAHAYTMASFLSVLNARTDEYGGSFANRMRLPLEVVEEVRGAVGREFLVGCRMLGSEDVLGADGRIAGNTLDDAREIAVALARAGLDFLSISRGGKFEDALQPPVGEAMYPYTGNSGAVCIPRRKGDPPGVNTFLATGIRDAVRAAGLATPVVASGRISTFAHAEAILREERADLVGMARALLADPDLPRKWLAGADRALRACVFCPYCEDEDQHHRTVTCTLWPKDPGNHRRRVIPDPWTGMAQ